MSQDDWPKRKRRDAARARVEEAGFGCRPANQCMWVYAHGHKRGAGRYISLEGILDNGIEYVVEMMARVGSEPEFDCDENGDVHESDGEEKVVADS